MHAPARHWDWAKHPHAKAAVAGTGTDRRCMMDTTREGRFFLLVQRFNTLGQLLPDPNDFDASMTNDVKLGLAEMARTQRHIDALLTERSGTAESGSHSRHWLSHWQTDYKARELPKLNAVINVD